MKAPAKKKAVPAKPVPKSAPKTAAKKKPSPKAVESLKAEHAKAARPVRKKSPAGPTPKQPVVSIRAVAAPKKSPKPAPKPASKSATKVAGARVKTSPKKKPAAVRPATRKPLASSRGTGPKAVKPTAKATKSPAVVKPAVPPAAGGLVKPAVAPKPAPIKQSPVTTTKSVTAAATAKPATPPKVAVASKPAKVPLRSPAKAAKPVAAKPAQALIELPAMPQTPKKKLTLEIPALLLEGDHTPGAQPGGPGSRYALGQAARTGAATEDEPALPEAYGTRKLWLVPRDPQWLYAHWDLDAAQLHEYNRLSRDGHLLLRIFDAGDATGYLTEIQVHPESRSWFAHVGKGGGRYFAVLGFRDKTGEWNEINRSEAVGTPPDSLSPEVEVQFVTLPSTVPVTLPATAPVAPEPAVEPPSATVAEVIEAVREYLAGEPVLAQAIETARAAQPADLPEPVELPPPAEFAHWTPAQQQALARVISMEAVRQVWAGSQTSSLALAESLEARRQKDLASVAAIPAPAPGGVAVAAPGGISSPHGGAPAERSFWFNVNAELVVYGATEPNAKVVIGGRLIRLRQDGTFSYRFALPDGWYGLPISATSADGGETRDATLKFMRETEYRGDVGTHPQDAALKTPAPEHTS
jgi:uncharacterized protein